MNQRPMKILAIATLALLVSSMAGWGGFYFYLASRVEQSITDIKQRSPVPLDIHYSSLWFNPLRQELSIKGLEANGGQPLHFNFSVAEISLRRCDWFQARPLHCSISMNGIRLKMSAEPIKTVLKKIELEMGEPLILDLKIRYRLRPKQNNRFDSRLELRFAGLGSLAFDSRLSGIDFAAEKFNWSQLGAALGRDKKFAEFLLTIPSLGATKVHRAGFTFLDEGLSERMMRVFAENRQITLAQFKNLLLASIKTSLEKKRSDKQARIFLRSCERYLKRPRRLGMEFVPTEPETLLSIAGRVKGSEFQALQALGVTLRINGSKLPFSSFISNSVQTLAH